MPNLYREFQFIIEIPPIAVGTADSAVPHAPYFLLRLAMLLVSAV